MRLRHLLYLGGWVALASVCLGQTTSPAHSAPVATINGQAVYESELKPLVQAQMRQIQAQEFAAKSRALDNLVNQKLLDAEAKKRGITSEELLEQEVDAKITQPSDGEIEAYYLAQKERLNQPLASIRAQLAQALRRAKTQQARNDYLQSLREKADVTILLHPPKTEVSFDQARLRGDPKAPITIVEFSDFQCPFCERVEPTLRELLQKYDGQVKVAYRDFPLHQIHANAMKAAEASRCAGEQGKFWEYHDLLFADQSNLNDPALTDRARKVGLNVQEFEACLSGGKYKDSVQKDQQDGMGAGVSGTPAFFVNGVFLSGAQPISEFEKLIENELASMGKKP